MALQPWMDAVLMEFDVAEKNPGENPRILEYWDNLGIHPQHDEGLEWCGAFASFVLDSVNASSPHSPWPAAFKTIGTALTDPVQGCVAVKKNDVHVTFVMEVHPTNGKLLVIGGNQSNGRVSMVWKPKTDYYVFRMPTV